MDRTIEIKAALYDVLAEGNRIHQQLQHVEPLKARLAQLEADRIKLTDELKPLLEAEPKAVPQSV